MYSVKIRDHVMIAHSLNHPGFGIASRLHGATYVIDATFSAPDLNEMNVVIDIALAANLLSEITSTLNYKNLDDIDELKGAITTTEYMAKYIHNKIAKHAALKFKGHLKIELAESHIAWASYAEDIDTI